MKRWLGLLLALSLLFAANVGFARADARPALDQAIQGTYRIIIRKSQNPGDTALCTAFSIGQNQGGNTLLLTAGHCAEGAIDSFTYMGNKVYSIVWLMGSNGEGDDWAIGITNLPVNSSPAFNGMNFNDLVVGDTYVVVGYPAGVLMESLVQFVGVDSYGYERFECVSVCPGEGGSGSAVVDKYGNLVAVMDVGYYTWQVGEFGQRVQKSLPFIGGTSVVTILSDMGY